MNRRLDDIGDRVSAARAEAEARGETFYPGPSRIHLAAFPPKERWDDWVELDSRAWPERVERRYMLVPTTCFNCESACGLLAYVDRETLPGAQVRGQPRAPRLARPQLRQGPGHAQPGHRSGSDPVPAQARRRARRGPLGAGRAGTRRSTTSPPGSGAAITEGRPNEVMYHVGRPGEDGFTERVLAAWGVDGHNSHTNVCSSRRPGRLPLLDGHRPAEPRPRQRRRDPADQRAPRVRALLQPARAADHGGEGERRQADRLRHPAVEHRHARRPLALAAGPGSEAAILLAIANHLIRSGRYDREFVRRWWNWQEYLAAEHPDAPRDVRGVRGGCSRELYARVHVRVRRARVGRRRGARSREVAELVAGAGTRLSTHTWRSAAAGNLGGWQVSRMPVPAQRLLGAVATPGGTYPERLEQVRARARSTCRRIHPTPGTS